MDVVVPVVEAELRGTVQQLTLQSYARVAKLADARDLKSLEGQPSWEFDPPPEHWVTQ